MNTKKQTFVVVALAMMIALAIVPTLSFGQKEMSKQPTDWFNEEQSNTLVGVWENKGPSTFNCQTGLPDPDAPIIRELYTFNQGGTMSEDNTDPIDGPYRTTSHGIWKHTYGQNYITSYIHYSFNPDRTLAVIVKTKTNIRLNSNSSYFTENGTFEVLDPNDNDKVVFSGCFSDTSKRLTF